MFQSYNHNVPFLLYGNEKNTSHTGKSKYVLKVIPMVGFYNITLKIHEYIPLYENKPITPNCISFKMIKYPFTGTCS